MSDYKGAALMLERCRPAKILIADRAMTATGSARPSPPSGIAPCIPSKPNRKVQHRLRHGASTPAPQDREHVRQAQGLAAHRNPLRPMRPHLLLRHLHRRHRHLLARSMSPEPRRLHARDGTQRVGTLALLTLHSPMTIEINSPRCSPSPRSASRRGAQRRLQLRLQLGGIAYPDHFQPKRWTTPAKSTGGSAKSKPT